MVGVMAMTSFKRACARAVVFSASDPMAGTVIHPSLRWRLLDTHRPVWLSLLWGHCSFLLGPCAHKVLFAPFCLPRVCFPVLWNFCNQIPLAFKVKFPGSSQFLCWIPRLGNLLRALEFSQQCRSFFGIIVLQFVDCLLSGSVVGLTCHASQLCCNQSPYPRGQPLLTRASIEYTQTLKLRYGSAPCGVPESWCTHLLGDT